MPGFKTYVAKNVSLHVNDRLEVGAVLGVAGVTEAVEVTASAGLIQPGASAEGTGLNLSFFVSPRAPALLAQLGVEH